MATASRFPRIKEINLQAVAADEAAVVLAEVMREELPRIRSSNLKIEFLSAKRRTKKTGSDSRRLIGTVGSIGPS